MADAWCNLGHGHPGKRLKQQQTLALSTHPAVGSYTTLAVERGQLGGMQRTLVLGLWHEDEYAALSWS